MERDNLNARYTAGSDLFAVEVGKPGSKLNILGIEITPDDSRLRGATNRTGISGKTMLEQMSHQPDFWAVGGGEGTTGGGTGGSEDNHGTEPAGPGYRTGSQDPGPVGNAGDGDPSNRSGQTGSGSQTQGQDPVGEAGDGDPSNRTDR
jgi:hypothetical protein